MTRQELDARLQENEHKMSELEQMLQQKIDIEMKSARPDGNAVLRMKDQISSIRARAIRQQDNIKKEYAMQNSPADIGDVIEAEIKIGRGGSPVREIIRLMRVERIEVAAYEEPQLTYYGTYLKRDLTPQARQIFVPIHQRDITKFVKSK